LNVKAHPAMFIDVKDGFWTTLADKSGRSWMMDDH